MADGTSATHGMDQGKTSQVERTRLSTYSFSGTGCNVADCREAEKRSVNRKNILGRTVVARSPERRRDVNSLSANKVKRRFKLQRRGTIFVIDVGR